MKSHIQHGSDGVETDSSEEEMKQNMTSKGLKGDQSLQNVSVGIHKNERQKKTLKYYGKAKKGQNRTTSPTKERNRMQRQPTKSPERAGRDKTVKGSSASFKIQTTNGKFRSKDVIQTNEAKYAKDENNKNEAVEPDQGIIDTSEDSLLIHGLARDWVEDEMSEDSVFM